MRRLKHCCIIVCCLLLMACSSDATFAPVDDLNPILNANTYKPTPMHALPARNQVLFPAKIDHWMWPLRGKNPIRFYKSQKGLDIVGTAGDPVIASANGEVVFCGNGLKNYGKLIILKHNKIYLSAYAYNAILFVRLGEWVRAGQKIAEVGTSDRGIHMLHFEIRRNGVPVDPLILLNKH